MQHSITEKGCCACVHIYILQYYMTRGLHSEKRIKLSHLQEKKMRYDLVMVISTELCQSEENVGYFHLWFLGFIQIIKTFMYI